LGDKALSWSVKWTPVMVMILLILMPSEMLMLMVRQAESSLEAVLPTEVLPAHRQRSRTLRKVHSFDDFLALRRKLAREVEPNKDRGMQVGSDVTYPSASSS
jgi:hypothetical protein